MISVIIPIYNEELVINECLESLLKQKNADFEIIIVDDGSTDNSKFIVQNFKSQLKDKNLIRYFEQKHLGPGIARNLGAAQAKGEILVFVDSDMAFEENFLYKLTEPIFENKTKGTFTKDEYVSNWNNVWARCWNYNENKPENLRVPKDYPDKSPVFRSILKTEFVRVKGFSSIGYTDDWSLSRKLGYKATLAVGAICYHRNPSNLTEIFNQARWIGRNEFITAKYRKFPNLIRYSFPFSFCIGIYKVVIFEEARFIIFKFVYDFSVFLSIVASFISNKRYI